MKTLFRTIKISIFTILLTCCFALAQESLERTSEPVLPERPVRNEMESDAAYRHRLTRWEAEIRHLTAEANTEQSLPERPEKRHGESDTVFMNRTRQWEAEIRRLTAEVTPQPATNLNLPARPVKRDRESDASFTNRTNQWIAEVRRITANTNYGTSTGNSEIPSRPVRRDGESESSFQNRVNAWQAEVKLITDYQKQNDNELDKLRKELARLSEQVTSSIETVSYNNTKPESISVIPMGEIEFDKLITINEDLKIMSQILQNELNQQSKNELNQQLKSVQWIFNDGKWLPINLNTGTTLINANSLSSMYLQDYGALFQLKVNFPLSSPTETAEQSAENGNNNTDQVWESTKQQILDTQQPATTTYSGSRAPAEAQYDFQQVENLKSKLIQTLKYAANIRALKSDESVIVRIEGTGRSIRILTVKQDGDRTLVLYESDGVQRTMMIEGDLKDYIKSLSTPTAIVIRAKKSDIDAFAKNELDFDKFNEKVQVFSYPVISGN